MAVVDFNLVTSNVQLSGNWIFQNAGGGHTDTRQSSGPTGEIEFKFTGTDCSIQMFGPATIYALTVDGASTTFTPPASTWTFQVIATGLTDTLHTVKIKQPFGTNMYLDAVIAVRVTGAAPSTAQPDNFSTQLDPFLTTTQANIKFEGPMYRETVNYPGLMASNERSGSVRFRGNPTMVRMWMYSNDCTYTIYRDGISQGNKVNGNQNYWTWVDFTTGFDGSTHEYEIIMTGRNPGSAAPMHIWRIMIIGGTFSSTPSVSRTQWLFLGDSITDGLAYGQAWAYRICSAVGVFAANAALTGRLLYTGLRDDITTYCDATNGLVIKPVNIFIHIGRNDWGSSISIANFQDAYTTSLAKLVAKFPGANIYCIGMLYVNNANTGTPSVTQYKDATKAAVQAIGLGRVKYIDPLTWLNTTSGIDTYDGTHPTDDSNKTQSISGQQKYANNAILNAYVGTTALARNLIGLGVEPTKAYYLATLAASRISDLTGVGVHIEPSSVMKSGSPLMRLMIGLGIKPEIAKLIGT